MDVGKSATLLVLLVVAECFTALPVSDSETSTVEGDMSPPTSPAAGATEKHDVDSDSDNATAGPASPPAEKSGDPAPAGGGDDAAEESTNSGPARNEGDPEASSPAAAGGEGTTEGAPGTTKLDAASEGAEDAADMEGAESMVFIPMFGYYPSQFQ